MTTRIASLLVVAFLILPASTLAQQRGEDELARSPTVDDGTRRSGVAPTDVVRLRDGGMARGVISELVAGEYVEIQTVGGATRRFDASEVAYAGPASDDPTTQGAPARSEVPAPTTRGTGSDPVRPLVTIHDSEAPLRLRAMDPDLTFHIRTSTAQASYMRARAYDRICSAPCTASLPSGTYTLALSVGNDDPVEVDETVTIDGPSTLTGDYTSNAGLRLAGWITLIGGTIGGVALFYVGAGNRTTQCDDLGCHEDYDPDVGLIGLGLGTVVVANVVGLIMALWGDDAEVTVE